MDVGSFYGSTTCINVELVRGCFFHQFNTMRGVALPINIMLSHVRQVNVIIVINCAILT